MLPAMRALRSRAAVLSAWQMPRSVAPAVVFTLALGTGAGEALTLAPATAAGEALTLADDRHAGASAGRGTGAPYLDAVDPDARDPGGELLRMVSGGVVDERGRIEQHQVGVVAGGDGAAFADPNVLGA